MIRKQISMYVKKTVLSLLIIIFVLIGFLQADLLPQRIASVDNENSASVVNIVNVSNSSINGFSDPVKRIEFIAKRLVKHLMSQPGFVFPKNYAVTSAMLYKLETMPVILSYTGEINAWTDGNAIYIASAMFDFSKSDSELAIVLAHEMSHVIKNHKGVRVISATTVAAMSTISDAFISGLGNLVNLGSKLVLLKYDRHQENEADHLALQIINKAQYDMDEAIKIYERLDQDMPTMKNFLNSHPSSRERVVNLKRLATKIKQLQTLPINRQSQVVGRVKNRPSSNEDVTRQQSKTRNVVKPFPQEIEEDRLNNSAKDEDEELEDLLDGYWERE